MGITKIWSIKDSLSRVVGYAENAEKTEFSDMQQVLHYAQNGEKVTSGPEKTMYVTTLHCRRDHACEDMQYVKRHFNKTGGNLAYHCVQSFKTGEVSPELCHQLGVELARQMWGDRFQVLIATHFNTGTYHNHLVINSVSYKDGRKFNCNKRAFYRMREISDALCREHNLTVIEHPQGKTPRNIYFAEKRGEPTAFNLMREAIDQVIPMAYDWIHFCTLMESRGYHIQYQNRKYPTICAVGAKKAVRMFRLGEEYDPHRIRERIAVLEPWEKDAQWSQYRGRKKQQMQQPRTATLAGKLKKVKKLTGFRALYLHYCYFLGLFPKQRRTTPLSPAMRQEVRKLQQYSRQMELIHWERLYTQADVENFLFSITFRIEEKEWQRKELYNRMRRSDPGERMEILKEQRTELTRMLTTLRQQQKIAQKILEQVPEMEKQLRIEQRIRQRLHHPQEKKKHRQRQEIER